VSSLQLLPLSEEHIVRILEIEKLANGAPWSERSFRNELTHDHSRFLVAFQDGLLVGYGGMWLVVDEAHITTVAVHPAHRKKGIGQSIMVELLQLAQQQKMECSSLEVRAQNQPALNMYRKLGYCTVAVRPHYYPDNREDAVVMWIYDLPAWKAPA